MFVGEYIENCDRNDHSMLIQRIIILIHRCGGRFLKYKGDQLWEHLDESAIRHRISHALRDAAVKNTQQRQKRQKGKISACC